MMKKIKIVRNNACLAIALALLFAACGTKKAVVSSSSSSPNTTMKTPKSNENNAFPKLNFIQKVADNAVYATDIVGDLKLNIKANGHDISAPGSLHMRKNQVIRIQVFIPILGTEVGRLEFTPDYVLLIDRLHKEYIQASYQQLDFLKNNGLNFYSLQSLFWNQLFLPGTNQLTSNLLQRFDAQKNAHSSLIPVTVQNGELHFNWNCNAESGLIQAASVVYQSQKHGRSTLDWHYDNFKPVGVKQFPAWQSFTFTTTATQRKQSVQLTLDMEEVTTKANWDAKTTVSSKYKKVETQDVLGKIMNL